MIVKDNFRDLRGFRGFVLLKGEHPMRYTFRPLQLSDALEIGRWRYEGQYAFYNLSLGDLLTSWFTQRLLRSVGFLHFYSVLDESERLVGLFTFTRSGDTVEIGLALRPNATGKGQGLAFVQAGMAFARQQWHPRRFKLEVATFNTRAITVYRRAGFVPGRVYQKTTERGPHEYLEMTRPANDV